LFSQPAATPPPTTPLERSAEPLFRQPAAAPPAAVEATAVETAAAETGVTEAAPVKPPLEEVWPVQRRAVETEPPPPPDSGRPAVQRKPASSEPSAADVHQALQTVAPGQTTDSAIELIMPRRPRPTAPPPVQRAEEKVERPFTPPVDQWPVSDGPATHPSLIAAAAARAEAAPPAVAVPAPAVQRQADSAPTGAPTMIPTPIGDLPSDLWTLIGQKPPGRKQAPATTGGLAPASRPDVQRAIAAAEAPPPRPVGAEPATALARQPAAPAATLPFAPLPLQPRVDSGSAPAVQREESGEVTGPAEAGIDLEQLSEQVYNEIRRRLAVEWERGRGRL